VHWSNDEWGPRPQLSGAQAAKELHLHIRLLHLYESESALCNCKRSREPGRFGRCLNKARRHRKSHPASLPRFQKPGESTLSHWGCDDERIRFAAPMAVADGRASNFHQQKRQFACFKKEHLLKVYMLARTTTDATLRTTVSVSDSCTSVAAVRHVNYDDPCYSSGSHSCSRFAK
jgi:hypothetical protein